MSDVLKRAFLVLTLIGSVVVSAGARRPELPVPRGPVNDFAGVLNPAAVKRLTALLKAYEYRSGNEIVIVLSPAVVDRMFARRVFDYWHIGKPGQHNGLLIMVTRKSSYFVLGRRLAPLLNTAQSKKYEARLNAALARMAGAGESDAATLGPALEEVVRGLTKDLEKNRRRSVTGPYQNPLAAKLATVLFICSMLLFPWLAAIFGRSAAISSGAIAGVLTGVIMLFFGGPAFGLGVSAFLAPVGWLIDRLITNNYLESRRRNTKPAWWAGGDWA